MRTERDLSFDRLIADQGPELVLRKLPIGERASALAAIRRVDPEWYRRNRHCAQCGEELLAQVRLSARFCGTACKKRARRRRLAGVAQEAVGGRGYPFYADPGERLAVDIREREAMRSLEAQLDDLELRVLLERSHFLEIQELMDGAQRLDLNEFAAAGLGIVPRGWKGAGTPPREQPED